MTAKSNAVRDLVDADRELALLRELIQAASSGPGVEPLAEAAARMITTATATDVCFVHVLDDTERSLTLTGATPPFDSEVGKIRLPLGQGISGWVASHREPVVIIHDKESDPRYKPFESLRGSDFTSMVSVPMETDPGGLVGVLNVHTVQRREFADRDVELLLVMVGSSPAPCIRHACTGNLWPAIVPTKTSLSRSSRRRNSSDADWQATFTTASASGSSRCPTGWTPPAAPSAPIPPRRQNNWRLLANSSISRSARPVLRSTDFARRCSTTSG